MKDKVLMIPTFIFSKRPSQKMVPKIYSVRVIAQLSTREYIQEKSLRNVIFVRNHSVRVLAQLSIKGFIKVKSLVCVVFVKYILLIIATQLSIKKIHLGEKAYSCEICQKLFTVRALLASHNKSAAHLKQNEKKE